MRRLALLLPLLCGCSAISSFELDTTHLEGKVPTGLGRTVNVVLEDGDQQLSDDLLAALEQEFTGRDLFDVVQPSDGSGESNAATLRVTFLRAADEELIDFFLIKSAYGCRYEMDIELRGVGGDLVLQGHVDAIGLDDITEFEYLKDEKRRDVRLAAINDGAMKISRGLRQAANDRAFKALVKLPEFGLPQGVGPLEVSVLGFDDPPNAARLRGEQLAEHLTDAMSRLGPDFAVTPHPESQRAVEREPPSKGFADIADYEVAHIGRHLPDTRIFVVGRLKLTGGRVDAEARVLDRKGKVLLARKASAEGLGALPVVAIALAEKLGEALQTAPLAPKEGDAGPR